MLLIVMIRSILQMLRPDIKKVSVVVPNYNYEEYMASRLNSVFDQTYPIFETLVLDDCSKDNSVKVIGDTAEDAARIIELVENEENSGNVFRQWKKGVDACRGDLIWIAEADDLADPLFVARSIEAFDNDTAMSFTNSKQIDTKDELLAQDYNYYYRIVDQTLFGADFNLTGAEFIERAMSTRNVIMNVSSVVWNRKALNDALMAVGDELFDLKLVGDWRLYLEVLAQSGSSVAYISDSLNTHRRHASSVTHSMDHQAHLDEIQSMHALVHNMIPVNSNLERSMDSYIAELRKQFGLDKSRQKIAA